MEGDKKGKDIREYALKKVKEIVELAEKMDKEGSYWAEHYFYSEMQRLMDMFDEAFLIGERVEKEEVNALYFLFNGKYYRLYFRSSEEPMFAEEIDKKDYENKKLVLRSQSTRRRYF